MGFSLSDSSARRAPIRPTSTWTSAACDGTVLEYVAKHTAEHVALIGTHSTMRPNRPRGKSARLMAWRGRPESHRAVLPRGWHPDPRRRDLRKLSEILPLLNDPRQKEVVREAEGLVGQPDHLSIHAAASSSPPGR